jgi:uncharacterized protein YceH (UPF0502 family)
MSCPECMYISGHDEYCPRGAADRIGNTEAKLEARIEALEERVLKLEKLLETRDIAARQLGRVQ